MHGTHLLEATVKSMDHLLKTLVKLLRLHVVFVEEEQRLLGQQIQLSVQLISTTLGMEKKFVRAMALIKTLV